jgi:hypothetical protein
MVDRSAKERFANFGKRSNAAPVGVLHEANCVQASNWRSYATLAKVRKALFGTPLAVAKN